MIARLGPALACLAGVLPMAVPVAALAAGELSCTFTTLCSPLIECQGHPGVAFAFDLIADGLGFRSEDGVVPGTPLTHLTRPAFGALFAIPPDETLLLIVAGDGQAVMTQTYIEADAPLRSISYFGTCEPAL